MSLETCILVTQYFFFSGDRKKELQKAKSAEAQGNIENPNEDQNEIQSNNNSSKIDT
jgi:hypothetical protein